MTKLMQDGSLSCCPSHVTCIRADIHTYIQSTYTHTYIRTRQRGAKTRDHRENKGPLPCPVSGTAQRRTLPNRTNYRPRPATLPIPPPCDPRTRRNRAPSLVSIAVGRASKPATLCPHDQPTTHPRPHRRKRAPPEGKALDQKGKRAKPKQRGAQPPPTPKAQIACTYPRKAKAHLQS